MLIRSNLRWTFIFVRALTPPLQWHHRWAGVILSGRWCCANWLKSSSMTTQKSGKHQIHTFYATDPIRHESRLCVCVKWEQRSPVKIHTFKSWTKLCVCDVASSQPQTWAMARQEESNCAENDQSILWTGMAILHFEWMSHIYSWPAGLVWTVTLHVICQKL